MIIVSSPPFLKSRCSGLQRALQEDLICLYETSRTVSQVRTPGLYFHSRPRGAVGSDTFISAACSPCAMNLIRTTPHAHRGAVRPPGSLSYFIPVRARSRLVCGYPDYRTLLGILVQLLQGVVSDAWKVDCGHPSLAAFVASNPTSEERRDFRIWSTEPSHTLSILYSLGSHGLGKRPFVRRSMTMCSAVPLAVDAV